MDWYGCKFRRIKADKSWLLNTPASLHSLGERVRSIWHHLLRTLLLLLIFTIFHCLMCVCVCVYSASADWTDAPPDVSSAALQTVPGSCLSVYFCILQHHRRAERVTLHVWRIIHCKIHKPLLRRSQQENMQISFAHHFLKMRYLQRWVYPITWCPQMGSSLS